MRKPAARDGWFMQVGREAVTLRLIRQCVPPSPRREAWIARTERRLAGMLDHYAGVGPRREPADVDATETA